MIKQLLDSENRCLTRLFEAYHRRMLKPWKGTPDPIRPILHKTIMAHHVAICELRLKSMRAPH